MPRISPSMLLLACLTLVGCQGKPDSVVPVWGTVRYQGSPVPTGTVVFTPMTERGYEGPLAWADIRRDGTYRLVTGDRVGAQPGWYRITVMAVEMPLGMPEGSRPRMLLPVKYSDPTLSELACEVFLEKENQIDLNLD